MTLMLKNSTRIMTKQIQNNSMKVRSSSSIMYNCLASNGCQEMRPVNQSCCATASTHYAITAESEQMAEVAQVLGIILCERVLQDVLRRDAISCINIHNGTTVQDFPAVVPLVFAFAQVS